jgi:uncharacterized protein with PQ loop repeat
VINAILQVIAVVVTAVSWVPQAFRLLGSRDHSGVSLSSWALGGITGLVFCLYGISSHVWSLTLSEGAFAIGAAFIVATLIGWVRTGIYCTAGCAVSVLVVALASATFIGVLGIIGALGMRLLQLFRTAHSQSVAGMSSASWALLAANVTAWGLYGLRTNHWPLVVMSVLALASALVLLVVAHRVRSRTLGEV